MIKELDTVVLAKDLKEYQLTRGDVGAVVHVYEGGKAYEVEFVRIARRFIVGAGQRDETKAHRNGINIKELGDFCEADLRVLFYNQNEVGLAAGSVRFSGLRANSRMLEHLARGDVHSCEGLSAAFWARHCRTASRASGVPMRSNAQTAISHIRDEYG